MRFLSGSGSETLQFYLLFCKVTVDEDLLASLLPGPVTLVFTRTDLLNRNFNPDTNLIGVRIPDHLFIRLGELSDFPESHFDWISVEKTETWLLNGCHK